MGKDTSKQDKIVHPNSRKAKRMSHEIEREKKKAQHKIIQGKAHRTTAHKFVWFQEQIKNGTKKACTVDEVHTLIEKYLKAKEEDRKQLLEQKKGKLTTKQTMELRDDDRKLYETSGIDLPDLTDRGTTKKFLEWNGEAKFLQNIKLKNFRCPNTLASMWDTVSAQKKNKEKASSNSSSDANMGDVQQQQQQQQPEEQKATLASTSADQKMAE